MKIGIIIFIWGIFIYSTFANDKEVYMIIIGGGKTIDNAIDVKTNYEKLSILNNTVFSNIEIVLSDTVKGLNPGFYITIIGYCQYEDFANIVIQLTNKYIRGVYKRKVILSDNLISKNYISLKTDNPPFKGEYYSEPGAVIKKDKVIYHEKVGSFKIDFYLAWIKNTREIRYLSDLEYSKDAKKIALSNSNYAQIFANYDDTLTKCTEENNVFNDGPMVWHCNKQTCIFSNGIITISATEVEGGYMQVKYPCNNFSFREVLFYYLQKGHFQEFLTNDYNGIHKIDEYTTFKYTEDEISILNDRGTSWESISIKNGYIVYEKGGGA